MSDNLIVWVIYHRPSDMPDKEYVLRGQEIMREGVGSLSDFKTADTLEEIRRFVPPGAVRLDRWPEDEPQIVECWI